jgi:hypothetical protein
MSRPSWLPISRNHGTWRGGCPRPPYAPRFKGDASIQRFVTVRAVTMGNPCLLKSTRLPSVGWLATVTSPVSSGAPERGVQTASIRLTAQPDSAKLTAGNGTVEQPHPSSKERKGRVNLQGSCLPECVVRPVMLAERTKSSALGGTAPEVGPTEKTTTSANAIANLPRVRPPELRSRRQPGPIWLEAPKKAP